MRTNEIGKGHAQFRPVNSLQHIVAVHDEKKHQCSICDKSYSQKGHLSHHMRKEHNVDYA